MYCIYDTCRSMDVSQKDYGVNESSFGQMFVTGIYLFVYVLLGSFCCFPVFGAFRERLKTTKVFLSLLDN